MSRVGSPTSSYRSWSNSNGNGSVYQILIYNFWEYLSAAPPLEPNFERGLDPNAPIDPLVWGGLAAECRGPLRSFGMVRFATNLTALGILFAGNLLPSNPFIDDKTLMMIGFGLFVVAFLLLVICVRKLKRDMRRVVERVEPIFAKAGYTVKYDVEKTGVCYSEEHRFYIFHTPKEESVLDVLPPTDPNFPVEPVKVYIHAPWYRHFFLWKCDLARHYFFNDKQPPALQSIHPYLWGALSGTFHSHELVELRKKRTRTVTFLIVLAVFSFFAIRDNRPWWIPVSALLFLAVLAFFFYEHIMTKTTRQIGHDKWLESVHNWRSVMEPRGWHLEYHHKDESDDAIRTKICGGAPSDFVRFVPIHV